MTNLPTPPGTPIEWLVRRRDRQPMKFRIMGVSVSADEVRLRGRLAHDVWREHLTGIGAFPEFEYEMEGDE